MPNHTWCIVRHTNPPTVEPNGYEYEPDAKKRAKEIEIQDKVPTSTHLVWIPASNWDTFQPGDMK